MPIGSRYYPPLAVLRENIVGKSGILGILLGFKVVVKMAGLSITEADNNQMPEDFLRRDSSRRNSVRTLAILVFIGASFLSAAALAKYSYALPPSNSSHWISKTCKILDYRHAVSLGTTAIRTIAIVTDIPVPTRSVPACAECDQARAPAPDILPQSPFRVPPSA